MADTYELQLSFDWNSKPVKKNQWPLDHALYKDGQSKPVDTSSGKHRFAADDHVAVLVVNAGGLHPNQVPLWLEFRFHQIGTVGGASPLVGKGAQANNSYSLCEYESDGGPFFAPCENSGKGTTFAKNLQTLARKEGHWTFEIYVSISGVDATDPSKSVTREFVWDPELIVDPHG